MATYRELDITHARSITSQLRAIAASKAAERASRPSRSIHGSGYFHCQRQQVYGLLGYEQTDRKYIWEWDLAARAGDAVHALVQQEFNDSGKTVTLPNGRPAIEVTLDANSLPENVYKEFMSYKLGVRVDAVLKGLDGAEIPVEIKTVDPKYMNGPNQKYLPGKVADFEMQLQASLHFWRNTITGERSKYGLIYIINRGDISQRLEYLVEYNQELVEKELERVANIRDYWLQAKIPEGEYWRGPCNFCNWRSLCDVPDTLKK